MKKCPNCNSKNIHPTGYCRVISTDPPMDIREQYECTDCSTKSLAKPKPPA